jgi:hypothetical protein
MSLELIVDKCYSLLSCYFFMIVIDKLLLWYCLFLSSESPLVELKLTTALLCVTLRILIFLWPAIILFGCLF